MRVRVGIATGDGTQVAEFEWDQVPRAGDHLLIPLRGREGLVALDVVRVCWGINPQLYEQQFAALEVRERTL
jgi:hypothetical protein